MASIKTISPSTNKVVCELPETSLDEARDIARRSLIAFQSFRKLDLVQRRAIVERGLAGIQERKFGLGHELAEHMGRPVAASHKEIETMQKRADYLLDIAEEALASLPGRPEKGFRREIKKIPVGPTLIVFAWNVSTLSCCLQNVSEQLSSSSSLTSSSSTLSFPPC
jgi:acyl-CoA reductase-like NAD-dependent aldehyde dehydrogenase